jgi:hypothetical protein
MGPIKDQPSSGKVMEEPINNSPWFNKAQTGTLNADKEMATTISLLKVLPMEPEYS